MRSPAVRSRPSCFWAWTSIFWLFTCLAGCKTDKYHAKADKQVYQIIREKQKAALNAESPFTIDRPSETLRERLLKSDQRDLLSPVTDTEGEAEQEEEPATRAAPTQTLTLREALHTAAESSREYQNERESLYLTALDLTLERHQFSNRFASILSSGVTQTNQDNRSGDLGGEFTMTRRLAAGGRTVLNLGMTATKVLTGDLDSETLSTIEFELVQPLLRGAGKKVALEGLVQAEREVVYAVQEFLRFQKTFAVRIISDYYDVLERQEIVRNEHSNYRNLIESRERAQALYDAGRLPEVQLGQTRQNEYRARDRWISARQQSRRLLDRFRVTLGLPTDAALELDPKELDRLRSEGLKVARVEPNQAIRSALQHRLDLLVAHGRVEDAERKVAVAGNGLKVGLDFTFSANASSRPNNAAALRLKDGRYAAGLTLDLPLDRKAERNTFRESEINLDRGRRALEQAEDQVKLEVRDAARQLGRARESYTIQQSAVELAQRRVEAANLLLEAGRAQTRDLLEAQDALVEAQNALLRALVSHSLARLEFLRDTEQLEIDERIVPKGI